MPSPTPETRGLISLAAVIVVLPLLLPNAFYYDVVILIGINAIVCIGLNLLIGYAGQISLGHAGFFGIGAYFSAILTTNHGWPALAALLTGALFVGVLSFVLARPIMKLRGHYLAMGTLGFDRTRSVLIADPALDVSVLQIEARGQGVELKIVRSNPMKGVTGVFTLAAVQSSVSRAKGPGGNLQVC